jgi:arylsulfatase A
LVNDYAMDFISRKKEGPFFLYYPMMLTHSPYTPTPDSFDYQGGSERQKKIRKKDKKKGGVASEAENVAHRHFADMVAYTDKLVGKLLARLDELKIRDNTLVVFLGDNGTGRGTRSMLGDHELIGGKGMLTHRGMHVPLIVSWPSKMSGPGRVSHDLIDSTDILPTICEAAGVALPADLKIDGRSFFPQLRGEPGSPREWYYCWYAPQGTFVGEFAANHDFKLYRDGNLFDLRKDLEEESPLNLAELSAPAAAAKAKLQLVLDQFQNARPPELPNPMRGARRKDKAVDE